MSLLNFFKVDNVVERKIDYYVYTDGACSSNGMPDAKAGFGIYFGPNDPRNVSRQITGKQTNNTAELIAIIEVYKIIKEDIEINKKRIVIVSDSTYAIRCCGEYGKKMSLKNYKKGKLGKEKPIPNAKLVKLGYELYKNISNVTFMHVEAHTGKSDIHSLGNDGADKLANMAIGYNNCPYNNKDNLKIYLNVPYAKKDEAKKRGAKWDVIKKKWYTYDNNPDKQFLLEKFSL